MSDNKIKCGVIGCGYLGQHHARIYSELESCELVGICEADEARAKEISELYGCRVYATPGELASQCDAVSVVVPTDRHFEVSVPLLEAGCHLLIEKPLCNGLDEAKKILESAKANKSIVQVGHIEHFNPVMNYLTQAVHQPKFITADRLAPFNPRGTEVGVVLDLMIHDIGLILELTSSEIKNIESVGVSVLSPTEDIANARITFENGCVANLNTSRVSEKKVREIRVFQPNSYLSLDFMNQKGHLLKKEGQSLDRQEIPIEKGEPLKIELDSFIHCVKQAENPKINASFGMKALEVALQITEQIRANS
jgi:predicted dehydrogenase